jgi:hypothetical protein
MEQRRECQISDDGPEYADKGGGKKSSDADCQHDDPLRVGRGNISMLGHSLILINFPLLYCSSRYLILSSSHIHIPIVDMLIFHDQNDFFISFPHPLSRNLYLYKSCNNKPTTYNELCTRG